MILKIITEGLLLFFAIVGFIELFIGGLEYFFLRRYRFEDIFVVVPLRGNDESAEHIIRLLLAQTEDVVTRHGRPEIMIVDLGMEKEALEICSRLSLEYEAVKLCPREEAVELLTGKFR